MITKNNMALYVAASLFLCVGSLAGFVAGVCIYSMYSASSNGRSSSISSILTIPSFSPPPWHFKASDEESPIDDKFLEIANKDMDTLVNSIKTGVYPQSFEQRFRGPLPEGLASFASKYDPHLFAKQYANVNSSASEADQWKEGYFQSSFPKQYDYNISIGRPGPYTFYGYYWRFDFNLNISQRTIAIHDREIVFACKCIRSADVPLEVSLSGHEEEIDAISLTYQADGLINRASFDLPATWGESIRP